MIEQLRASYMVGSISYLKPGMKFFESRRKYHAEQLAFWESSPEDFPYYRVQIFWDRETEAACSTDMDLHAFKVNEPCPPGKARNILLRALYASDYDYLICCDDDQVLDPQEESFDFLKHLTVAAARQGALITFQNETWITTGKGYKMVALRNSEVGKNNHILHKAICTGNMQISCIPNLVKYGYEPVFFDEDTMAQEGEIPEDAKFQVDWITAGHPVYESATLFNVALDSYIQSSIYTSGRYRYMTNKTRIAVLNAYIRSLYPRRPDIQTLEDLSRLKNTASDSKMWTKTCKPGKLLGEDELAAKKRRHSRMRKSAPNSSK